MKADKRAKRAKQKTKAANMARQREKEGGGGFYGVRIGKQDSYATPTLPTFTQPRPLKLNPDGTRVDYLVVQKLKDYGLWEQMQLQSYANQNSQLIADDGCIFFWICNENGYSGYSWFHNQTSAKTYLLTGE